METLYRKVAVSEDKPTDGKKMYLMEIIGTKNQRFPENKEEFRFWLEEIPNTTAQLQADKGELLQALEKVIYIQDKYFGEQEIHSRLRALCVQIEYLIQKHKQ